MRSDKEREERFKTVKEEIANIRKEFPDGMVVIGGYATYLHNVAGQASGRAEPTADGDMVFSLAAFARLRAIRQISDNTNLGKHEFKVGKIGFDVYVEFENNDIRIPYAELREHAEIIDGVRCAAKEHLLIMKLDTLVGPENRRGSEHGNKDERDIANLIILTKQPRAEILKPYLDAERLDVLDEIRQKNIVFQDLMDGNQHLAKGLKVAYGTNFAILKDALARLEREKDNQR